MAVLPAVPGLMKHQLYWRDPGTGREQVHVQTFWTWRNEDPIPPERHTYESGAIKSWVQSAGVRGLVPAGAWGSWVKSWDMGQTPPARFTPLRIWPITDGLTPGLYSFQLSVVVALRTQAVGSAIRNRLNGRLHHPFPQADKLAGGMWIGSFRATVEGVYHGLRDVLKPAASADSGTWVVPCFFEAGALRVGGPLLPAVNHVIARQAPGVVRSRLPRPGPYARGA